jgi:hypothetical protein
MINAKLAVPLGTFVHCNAGEIPVEMFRGPLGGGVVAEQVNLIGIVVRSANDGLDTSSDGGGGGGGSVGGACCAMTASVDAASNVASSTTRRTIAVPTITLPI